MLLKIHSENPDELGDSLQEIDKELRDQLNKALDDMRDKTRDNKKAHEVIEKVRNEYFFSCEREGNVFIFNVKYFMENFVLNKFLKDQLFENILKADATARRL